MIKSQGNTQALSRTYSVLMKCVTLITFIFIGGNEVIAQFVYKTPSGKKYHLYTCRFVKNVSQKISLNNAIKKYGLTPCKVCKPPTAVTGYTPFDSRNKAVGECVSVRCRGTTQKGTRCKRRTKMCNGYCFQHGR